MTRQLPVKKSYIKFIAVIAMSIASIGIIGFVLLQSSQKAKQSDDAIKLFSNFIKADTLLALSLSELPSKTIFTKTFTIADSPQKASGKKSSNITLSASDTKPINQPQGEVLKRIHHLPGGNEVEYFFSINSQKIAYQKMIDGKIIESEGEIPDGIVKFIDHYENVTGEETYKNGKRQGIARTYDNSNLLLRESVYNAGKLVSSKEFYPTGEIRLIANYTNAKQGVNLKEIGVGKIFYRDGSLKYEWRFTNDQTQGTRKAYGKDGQIISEEQYIADNKYETY